MRKWLNWASKRRFPYEPLIHIELSKQRLIHNLEEFRTLAPNGSIAPVLKSNAYGHGLFEVAEMLSDASRAKSREGHHIQIPFCVVDSYFEAVALRSRGFKLPLLIMGYTRPEIIRISRLKHTAFTITSLEQLRAIKNIHRPVLIHLKIDTGMHRQGIRIEEADEAIELLHESMNLLLEGICTHLCDADNTDTDFTETQVTLWNKVAPRFKSAFPSLKYLHAGATDGAPFSKELEANVLRLGIGLYGLSDNSALAKLITLLPIMEMRTILTGIKKIHPGEGVGYGRTFHAEKEMIIATVPAGYFEGVDRRLSSVGTFLVGPHRIPCPIVGRVSMNISTIDVSGVPDVAAGMVVVVLSSTPSDPNSITTTARTCGTIPYEIAVHIPGHLKRNIV